MGRVPIEHFGLIKLGQWRPWGQVSQGRVRSGPVNLDSRISGARTPDQASLLMTRSDDEQTSEVAQEIWTVG